VHKVGDLIGKLVPKAPQRTAEGQATAASVSIPRGAVPPASAVATHPKAASPSQPTHTETPTPKASSAGQRYTRSDSRARRYGPRSELTLVKGVLSKVLAKKGLEKKVERYGFVLYWSDIVGEQLAQVSRPECISRRALIVRVSHSTWAQELAFMKPVLLAKLAHYLMPGDIVEDMIFRIGVLEP
jgi:hypothetical protein